MWSASYLGSTGFLSYRWKSLICGVAPAISQETRPTSARHDSQLWSRDEGSGRCANETSVMRYIYSSRFRAGDGEVRRHSIREGSTRLLLHPFAPIGQYNPFAVLYNIKRGSLTNAGVLRALVIHDNNRGLLHVVD